MEVMSEAQVVSLLENRVYYGDPKAVAFACAQDVTALRAFIDSRATCYNESPRAWDHEGPTPTRVHATNLPALVVATSLILSELEAVFRLAFSGCADFEIQIWSRLRLPLFEARSPFGETHWRPYTRKEVSQELRDVYGIRTPYYQVGRIAHKLDEKLYKELKQCGRAA
jgi:hypothetical protein